MKKFMQDNKHEIVEPYISERDFSYAEDSAIIPTNNDFLKTTGTFFE